METYTSNTQSLANYRSAVQDIQSIFNDYGFTTNNQFDPEEFEAKLVETIRQNIEGNVTYAPTVG